MQVASEIEAGKSYTATLPYRIAGAGDVTIAEACFTWSGEGPYCFDGFRDDRDAREVSMDLVTRNPNRYLLAGFVKYRANGHAKESNEVSAAIRVR